MAAEYFLGIDGGASKTAGVLLELGGQTAATCLRGGSSIIGPPQPKACAVLAEVVTALCGQAGCSRADIRCCGIGLNGIDFADELPVQHREIARALELPPGRMALVNDGIPALWGASARPASVILQHGSGFTGGYRSRYGNETLFDHLSVGNTYDLRWGLISTVARMIDGRLEPTPLLTDTLKAFDVSAAEYAESVFRQRIPRERMKNTAPLVFRAWEAGDPAAAHIVEQAVADYALAAWAMLARTGCPDAAVAFGGGVIRQAPPTFWDLLAERVHSRYPTACVKAPELPAEYGAAIMAAFLAGEEPATLFTKAHAASGVQ